MIPRGIRNNNPGNIRKSGNNWQGLALIQSDPAFFVFKAPHWGIRALARTLKNYQKLYGISTIEGIINRWAPPVENNTGAYVNSVAKQCGVAKNTKIDLAKDQTLLRALVKAIITHENGQCPYTDKEIADAVADS